MESNTQGCDSMLLDEATPVVSQKTRARKSSMRALFQVRPKIKPVSKKARVENQPIPKFSILAELMDLPDLMLMVLTEYDLSPIDMVMLERAWRKLRVKMDGCEEELTICERAARIRAFRILNSKEYSPTAKPADLFAAELRQSGWNWKKILAFVEAMRDCGVSPLTVDNKGNLWSLQATGKISKTHLLFSRVSEANPGVPLIQLACGEFTNMYGLTMNGNVVRIVQDDAGVYYERYQGEFLSTDVRVTNIQNSRFKIILLTSNGCVYEMSSPNHLQSKFNVVRKVEFPTRIVNIAAGGNHCLALGEDGVLWGWGSNACFQLGPELPSDLETPEKIIHNCQDKIVGIACGHDFSYFWTSTGAAYSFGSNVCFSLGRPTGRDFVERLDSVSNVAYIVCGVRHTLIMLKDETMISFGIEKFLHGPPEGLRFFGRVEVDPTQTFSYGKSDRKYSSVHGLGNFTVGIDKTGNLNMGGFVHGMLELNALV